MPVETWNYDADGLEAQGKVLKHAALAAMGTSIRVAPFEDDALAKLGVWLRGDSVELEAVRRTLDESLQESKVKFSALQWMESRRRG